jgi:hypothetical protein
VTFTAAATGCRNANPLYEFWMRATSSPGWTMVQGYSTTTTFAWNTNGLAGGYYLSVWAKDSAIATANFDANATTLYSVKPPSCASVTLSPAPGSPQNAGTKVVFTAQAVNCPDPPVYEFWMRAASSSSWRAVQAYSTNNTFTWDTSGAVGGYYISVWAKDTASPTPNFDANATVPYAVNSTACTAVTLSQSPTVMGQFVASASGCGNPGALYEFWARPASSNTWTVVCPYSSTNGCTVSFSPGSYYISVWAKDAASGTSTFDVNATVTYVQH